MEVLLPVSVCLSVRQITQKVITEFDDNFIGFMDPSSGFLNDSLFTITIPTDRQPRIEHENPRRRFELPECFLLIV